MKQVTSARGQNTRKGGSDPVLCGLQPPKLSWGRSRPPRTARGRVLSACRDRSRQFVMQGAVHRERAKEKTVATTEGTIETTKDYNPSGSSGGRSQTQPGPIRRVHRRKCVLRRQRSTQAAVQAGRRIQTLAGRTSDQHQPRVSQRKRSYKDRVTDMKLRSTQSGMRENTASSRQHAPRSAMRSTPNQSAKPSDISREEARPISASFSQTSPLALRTMPRRSRPQRERKATESTF